MFMIWYMKLVWSSKFDDLIIKSPNLMMKSWKVHMKISYQIIKSHMKFYMKSNWFDAISYEICIWNQFDLMIWYMKSWNHQILMIWYEIYIWKSHMKISNMKWPTLMIWWWDFMRFDMKITYENYIWKLHMKFDMKHEIRFIWKLHMKITYEIMKTWEGYISIYWWLLVQNWPWGVKLPRKLMSLVLSALLALTARRFLPALITLTEGGPHTPRGRRAALSPRTKTRSPKVIQAQPHIED